MWEEDGQLFSSLGNNEERLKLRAVAINRNSKACGIGMKGEVFVLSRHRLQHLIRRWVFSSRAWAILTLPQIWDDRKTGCKPFDIGFWRPEASTKQQKCSETFRNIGDLAERSHADNPLGVGVLVRERLDPQSADKYTSDSLFPPPSAPLLLAPPVDFEVSTPPNPRHRSDKRLS